MADDCPRCDPDLVVAQKRAKNYGLDPDAIFYMGAWGLLAGILGAKLLFYLTEIKEIIKDPSLLLNVSEGFVVYGGIIGGILGAYIYAKIKKIDILAYFDLAVPSIAFAQGFGRIGCFLAGCCYGRETNAWYGITFHNSPFAPNEVALIPTQLISSVADFAHFFYLDLFGKACETQRSCHSDVSDLLQCRKIPDRDVAK